MKKLMLIGATTFCFVLMVVLIIGTKEMPQIGCDPETDTYAI